MLVDATNAFISFSPMQVEDFGDGTSSERVASLAPGAHVVKAFNTLFARFIAAEPRREAGRSLLFYAGDDAGAKERFAAFVGRARVRARRRRRAALGRRLHGRGRRAAVRPARAQSGAVTSTRSRMSCASARTRSGAFGPSTISP